MEPGPLFLKTSVTPPFKPSVDLTVPSVSAAFSEITLVCEECQKSEHPELCKHKLGSLPRWISSAKVEGVRTLLADDPVHGSCQRSGALALLLLRLRRQWFFGRHLDLQQTAARYARLF